MLTGENTGQEHSGILSRIVKPKARPNTTIQDTAAYDVEISDRQYIRNNFHNPIYRPLTSRIKYPHIALGSFARAFRDYIHYGVYDQFSGIIFGNYNKAIQQYLQMIRTKESPVIDIGLPIFSYTFQIDGLDDKTDMPWRSTTFLPGLSKGIYGSFYKDKEFELKIVYRRLKGTINSNIYCSSEAELLDIQMAFFDGFRGLNVYSKTAIRAMTVLPGELMFTDYMGRSIGRALTGNHITKAFVPTVNSEQYYVYNDINAIINMSNISQNSNYYGSGASLPEYNLSATFNFEIDIPQYVLCMALEDYVSIDINIDVSYKYEDQRVLNAIKTVTGEHVVVNYENDPSTIASFQNGKIIDSVAFNMTNETLEKISIRDLFPGTRKWHYMNDDIVLLIVYSGGVIRCPIDKDIVSYSLHDDSILVRKDLFNVDDFIEIYVFRIDADHFPPKYGQ